MTQFKSTTKRPETKALEEMMMMWDSFRSAGDGPEDGR